MIETIDEKTISRMSNVYDELFELTLLLHAYAQPPVAAAAMADIGDV
jgi:hypothetical protein